MVNVSLPGKMWTIQIETKKALRGNIVKRSGLYRERRKD
jgi:hypothetical protein